MKEITKAELDAVAVVPKQNSSIAVKEQINEVLGVTPEELAELEKQASIPTNLQKSLIAKLAAYTDYAIAKDLREKEMITDYTRRFLELYTAILTNLHKSLYGEKNVTVGNIKITHSTIMQEVRKHSKIVDAEFEEKNG